METSGITTSTSVSPEKASSKLAQYPKQHSQKRKRRATIAGPVVSQDPQFLRLIEVLNELDEMCAVGTVNIEMPRRGMAGIEAPDGWLWLETPAKKLTGESIEVWLEALIDRGYARATYIMTSPSRSQVRIYILPHDLGAGLVREMDATLKKDFRRLLEHIDPSSEAWKGDKVSEPKAFVVKSGLQEITSPTHEIYYMDYKELKLYKDPTYPEALRRTRYSFRRRKHGPEETISYSGNKDKLHDGNIDPMIVD